MFISKEKAKSIYDEVTKNNNVTIEKQGKIRTEKVSFDGWDYSFMFCENELKKIEEYNHRELIEAYVK